MTRRVLQGAVVLDIPFFNFFMLLFIYFELTGFLSLFPHF